MSRTNETKATNAITNPPSHPNCRSFPGPIELPDFASSSFNYMDFPNDQFQQEAGGHALDPLVYRSWGEVPAATYEVYLVDAQGNPIPATIMNNNIVPLPPITFDDLQSQLNTFIAALGEKPGDVVVELMVETFPTKVKRTILLD